MQFPHQNMQHLLHVGKWFAFCVKQGRATDIHIILPSPVRKSTGSWSHLSVRVWGPSLFPRPVGWQAEGSAQGATVLPHQACPYGSRHRAPDAIPPLWGREHA